MNRFVAVPTKNYKIREVIEDHHYLHKFPDPRSLPFSYLLEVDGELYRNGLPCGVIVFKKLQHLKQAGLFGYEGLPTHWQVLDMARVWINPSLQISQSNGHSLCAFSRFVSSALRRVQADWLVHHPPRFPHLPYHVVLIVSYCELKHHDGTAYRAANFACQGLSSDKTKEIYIKWLRRPSKEWHPQGIVQWPLFSGIPLVHG